MTGMIINPYSFGGGLATVDEITIMSDESFQVAASGSLERTISTSWGSIQENDIVLYQYGCDDANPVGSAKTSYEADGWTAIRHIQSNFPSLGICYKRMGATPDTSVTWDASGGFKRISVRELILRGVSTSSITNAVGPDPGIGTSATSNHSSITSTVDNSLILLTTVLDDDQATLSSVTAGWTPAGVLATTQGSGNDNTLGWASQLQPTAGLTSGPTFTFSSSDSIRGVLIAITPA